jgi:hypothetical protein
MHIINIAGTHFAMEEILSQASSFPAYTTIMAVVYVFIRVVIP